MAIFPFGVFFLFPSLFLLLSTQPLYLWGSFVCASGPFSFYLVPRNHPGILFSSIHLANGSRLKPGVQSVQAAGGISCGSAPMLLCLWAIFCFPSCSRRMACQSWDCAFFPPASRPASETQIRKDGTFFKKRSLRYLGSSFSNSRFLML